MYKFIHNLTVQAVNEWQVLLGTELNRAATCYPTSGFWFRWVSEGGLTLGLVLLPGSLGRALILPKLGFQSQPHKETPEKEECGVPDN